ncbi:adenylate/guanylate cyclase domain-containing protein [Variovorax sp. J22R133]|uniref:ATP-binding protein n=1 Tax=Variovorax brevis TaxID=3053503 RepID=UPI002578DA58|nr:adenylate/guanylate cyclase domain-containing protein [Variovorax sp. J22R133]MDM0117027.1 adenylate/guanylate cyclase domain-containing protein [Variovorax sp. J22R133]
MNDRQQLEMAIAALEAQRHIVGNSITDAALAPMLERLAGVVEHDQSLRQVTVLFTDVVGSTALSRQLDAEEVHSIIDGALRRLTLIVEGHRGRVLQYAGDSLLAVFGATTVLEDDAERAVRCGLAIVREAQQIGAEVRAKIRQGDFNVRVGVHTGTVLLGGGVDEASTIRGITVNIAARMEQTAPVGGVRISHETQHHVRGKFDLTEEPPITVKGFSEPMRSYLVVREFTRRVGMVGRGLDGIFTPTVGRERELAKLIEGFETVSVDGNLMHVTVSGEAGLGKTRLALDFEKGLKHSGSVFIHMHGRAQPYSNSIPYGLLRDLLTSHFGILDSDPQEVAREKLKEGFAAKLDEVAAEQPASVGRLIGLAFGNDLQITAIEGDGQAVRDRAFRTVAQYLRRLHQDTKATLLLLLDDLHWADDGSLDFVDHIVRACQDVPILILGLTRPTLLNRRPLWGAGQANYLRIDLEPLSIDGSCALADVLLARMDAVPAALRDLVAHTAEGNPYYIEELIGMLIDDGVIVVDEERWRVDTDRLLQMRVPSTLAGVLQARLDALPPLELAALRHASVIGHVFWDEALQQITPVASQTLDGLMLHDFTRARDASAFEGTREFSFKHHLLHSVTYSTVLKRDKREQHRLTAQWLLARSGDRANEYHGLIADHFERSGDADSAVLYLRKAAAASRSTFALTAALAYFDRALALMPCSKNRFYVLIERMQVASGLGHRAEDESKIVDLEQMAEQMDDDSLRAGAAAFRTTYAAFSNDLPMAEAAAAKALMYAQAPGCEAWAGRAHNQLGGALASAGEFERAQQHAEQSLALARLTKSWSGESATLNLLARIAREGGRFAAARVYMQSAIDLMQVHGDRVWELTFICRLAHIELQIGHFEIAIQRLRDAADQFKALDLHDHSMDVLASLAHAACEIGKFDEALEWIDRAGGPDREWDQQVWLLAIAGEAHLGLGNLREAWTFYERSLAIHTSHGRPMMALYPQAGLARLALMNNDLALAKSFATPIVAAIQGGWRRGLGFNLPRIMFTCYEVSVACDDAQANELLCIAHSFVKTRADLLEGYDKEVFLGVAANGAIIAAWESRPR